MEHILVEDLEYRLGVGMMIINHQGNILVGKRADSTANGWQMPQGGIDQAESPLAAAVRETYEEVGIKDAQVIAVTSEWYCYDLPESIRSKWFGGQYRGQKQQWFLIKYCMQRDSIQLPYNSPEFIDWKWVSTAELLNLIVPFKLALYQAVLREFQPIIENYTKMNILY